MARTLRELRRQQGLTQAALAAQVGVTRATVRAWEQTQRRPQPRYLTALAAALGVPVGELPCAASPRGPEAHAGHAPLVGMLPPDLVRSTVHAALAYYRLAPAERRVAWAVLRGLSTGEIGALLGVSPATVKNTLATAMARTGAATRLQFALQLLGIDPDVLHEDRPYPWG
jgi:transcriptional regulator with XRE-family HTH domain